MNTSLSKQSAYLTGTIVCIVATGLFMWHFKDSSLAVLFGLGIVIALRYFQLVG